MKKIITVSAALMFAATSAQAAFTTNTFTAAAYLRSLSGWQDGSASIPLKDAAETTTGLRHGLLRLDLTDITEPVTAASIKINAKKQVSYTLYLWGVVDGAPGQNWNGTTTTMADVAASGMYAPVENLQSAGDTNLVLLGSKYIVGTGVSQYDDYIFDSQTLTDWLNSDSDNDASLVVSIAENINTAMRSISTGSTAPELRFSADPADTPSPINVFQIGGDAAERNASWTAGTLLNDYTVEYIHTNAIDNDLTFTITATATNALDKLYLSNFLGVDSSSRGLDEVDNTGQTRRLSFGEGVAITLTVVDPNNSLETFGMSGVGPLWGTGGSETTTVTDASSAAYDFVAFPNDSFVQGNWEALGLEDITVASAASWQLLWTAGAGTQSGVGGFAFQYTLGDGVVIDPYTAWAALKGLTSGINDGYGDDAEPGGGDGMDNLLEYALGGDPLVDDAALYLPSESVDAGYLNYVYRRSVDAGSLGLTYEVLAGTDLVFNNITNSTDQAGTSGDLGDGFESVTNRVAVDTEAKQFMQLKVQKD